MTGKISAMRTSGAAGPENTEPMMIPEAKMSEKRKGRKLSHCEELPFQNVVSVVSSIGELYSDFLGWEMKNMSWWWQFDSFSCLLKSPPTQSSGPGSGEYFQSKNRYLLGKPSHSSIV